MANTQNNGTAKTEDVIAQAEELMKPMKETLSEVQRNLGDVSEKVEAEIKEAGEQASNFVRENPGLAIAGALGIGILAGIALNRR